MGQPQGGRGRIKGLDVARALAIVGMLAVHVGPTVGETPAELAYAVPHGRASILFVLVAGVGVTLLASSRRTSLQRARWSLLWRAALLLPAGLALQLLDHGVAVILQDYALLFVLAVALVGLGDRWLLGLAAASAVAGPLLYLGGTMTDPETFAGQPTAFGDAPLEILAGLVATGPYPLVTWAAPFLLGMWLGRQDLRDRRHRVLLLTVGGFVALAAAGLSYGLVGVVGEPAGAPGWDELVVDVPHSQMPLWLAGATGSALFVLGASLLAADAAPRALRPLVAAGQLALTVYVAHLLALHAWPDLLTSEDVGEALLVVAGSTGVACAFATAWRARFSRGPLEALLHPPQRQTAAR